MKSDFKVQNSVWLWILIEKGIFLDIISLNEMSSTVNEVCLQQNKTRHLSMIPWSYGNKTRFV